MAVVLISTLGNTKYEEANYVFEGRSFIEKYFACALIDLLGTREDERIIFDEVILFGTPESKWQDLAEGLPVRDGSGDVRSGCMEWPAPETPWTEVDLKKVASAFPFGNRTRTSFHLLPSTPATAEGWKEMQRNMLTAILGHLKKGDSVVFDVTYSPRWIPLVVLLAGLLVERLAGVEVRGIWYGQLGAKTPGEATPAWFVDLAWILGIAKLLTDIAVYDATGDAAHLANLMRHVLEEEGRRPEEVDRTLATLGRAAFWERTNVIDDAAAATREMKVPLAEVATDLGSFFAERIGDRFEWADETSPWRRRWRLAQRAIDDRRIGSALLLAQEAAVQKLAEEFNIRGRGFQLQKNVNDELTRFLGEFDSGSRENRVAKAYDDLKECRNDYGHQKEGRSRQSGEERMLKLRTPDKEDEYIAAIKECLEIIFEE